MAPTAGKPVAHFPDSNDLQNGSSHSIFEKEESLSPWFRKWVPAVFAYRNPSQTMERFIFLLALLCIDWYAETPLSPPMSSTQSVCKCISDREVIQRCLTETEHLNPWSAAACDVAPPSTSMHAVELAGFLLKIPSADPVYAFMSLQC